MLAAVGAYAQGTVNFANVGGGAAGSVNAPVTNSVSGARLDGATWVAQLYAGTSAGSLTPQGATANFLTGAQIGYFTGGQRTITGIAGGAQAVLQVRAWNIAAGSTYELAAANPAGIIGSSSPITITLGTPPATPPNMVGLTSFGVAPIPEPSSIALGLLGLGAVALFRRRK